MTFFLTGSGHHDACRCGSSGRCAARRSCLEANAVAAAILVVSLPLIALAAYLMRDEGAGARVAQGE